MLPKHPVTNELCTAATPFRDARSQICHADLGRAESAGIGRGRRGRQALCEGHRRSAVARPGVGGIQSSQVASHALDGLERNKPSDSDVGSALVWERAPTNALERRKSARGMPTWTILSQPVWRLCRPSAASDASDGWALRSLQRKQPVPARLLEDTGKRRRISSAICALPPP